jgi:hypothetical protein
MTGNSRCARARLSARGADARPVDGRARDVAIMHFSQTERPGVPAKELTLVSA